MTLSPSDAPDWSGIPGGLRLLGSISVTGNGLQTGTLDFTPATYDGSVYIVPDSSLETTARPNNLYVENLDTGAATLNGNNLDATDPPLAAFVARALGPSWRVTAQIAFSAAGPAEFATWYVFAVPAFPLVVPMNAATPFRVNIAAADGTDGVRMIPRPVDDQRFNAPGANTQAVLTFPATAGFRWVLAWAHWELHCTAAAAGSGTPRVLDGGTQIFTSALLIPAVANSLSALVLPWAGLRSTSGAALVVDFAAAGGVNTSERVSAAAYLVA